MKPIEQIRRENLKRLVEAERSQAAFARKVRKDKNQINQWLGRGTARNLSAETARELERLCDKPAGWMDHDHDTHANAVQEPAPLYVAASQASRLDPSKVRDTVAALNIFLRRRDPSATLNLEDPIDAELFVLAYAELEAMEGTPGGQMAAGAAILDLTARREGKRNARRGSTGQSVGSSSGGQAREQDPGDTPGPARGRRAGTTR